MKLLAAVGVLTAVGVLRRRRRPRPDPDLWRRAAAVDRGVASEPAAAPLPPKPTRPAGF